MRPWRTEYPDILNAFPADDQMVLLASFCVGLTNLLKFPLLALPLGNVVLQGLERAGWHGLMLAPPLPASALTSPSPSPELGGAPRPRLLVKAVEMLVLLGLMLVVAILANDNLSTVLAVTGNRTAERPSAQSPQRDR